MQLSQPLFWGVNLHSNVRLLSLLGQLSGIMLQETKDLTPAQVSWLSLD